MQVYTSDTCWICRKPEMRTGFPPIARQIRLPARRGKNKKSRPPGTNEPGRPSEQRAHEAKLSTVGKSRPSLTGWRRVGKGKRADMLLRRPGRWCSHALRSAEGVEGWASKFPVLGIPLIQDDQQSSAPIARTSDRRVYLAFCLRNSLNPDPVAQQEGFRNQVNRNAHTYLEDKMDPPFAKK